MKWMLILLLVLVTFNGQKLILYPSNGVFFVNRALTVKGTVIVDHYTLTIGKGGLVIL